MTNIEDRLRAELGDEAAGMLPRGGDIRAVQRRGMRLRRRRAAAHTVVAAAAVALAVPGVLTLRDAVDGAPPFAGEGSSTTSVSTTTPTTAPTTSTPSSSVPPPDDAPGIVVSGPDGVSVVREGSVVDELDIGPVMLAVADGEGGIVVQVGLSASDILWLPEGTTELVELVPAGPGETLTLHDVAVIDGVPTVLYTVRRSGPAPEDASEDLHLLALESGDDRMLAKVGGYESGPWRVSAGGGLVAVSMTAEGTTWFEFLDLDGSPVTVDANPRTEEESAVDFLEWVSHGVLSPDGSTFAYVRGHPRSEAPFHLVVVELATGEELVDAELPGVRDITLSRVDWDGVAAVVSVMDGTVFVVGEDGRVHTLPMRGTADL